MRVLLTGGGTAGHIFPALSVAGLLASDGAAVAFVGTPAGPECDAASRAGLDYVPLPSRGFDRSSYASLLAAVFTTVVSTARAWRLIGRFAPDAVVGFGGYVALPLGLAAVVRRVPLLLHEQNSVPGLANRLLSRWAVAVCATYDSSVGRFARPERVVVTGNPVREAILGVDVAAGRDGLGIHPAALVLLVFGGSRGARHVNRAVVDVAERVLAVPGTVVVHIAGPAEYADVTERVAAAGLDTNRYRVLEWLDDMGGALAAADVVVSRAGASSIAEITAVGRAAVLVPYPYATDDHQRINAESVASRGAARIVLDDELDSAVFAETVTSLLDDEAAREKMASAARELGRVGAARHVSAVVREHAAAAEERHGGDE